ncbi:MAG: hypothetical protein KDD53_02515 [Bdellovibrionales bacterium]|nr:hypothetical protein [Bdellovibrionales bacterium]
MELMHSLGVAPYHLHPFLSSFPVVLCSCALLSEFLFVFSKRREFRLVTRFSIVLLLLSTIAAFLSGYLASDLANQTFVISNDLIERHHFTGQILLFLVFPLSILNFARDYASYGKLGFSITFQVVLLATVLTAFVTGFRGGELVFEHGAGVSAVPLSTKGGQELR